MPNQDIKRSPEQRQDEAGRKLDVLRTLIKAGVDALDRGDFVEVDGAELEDFLQTAV